MKRLTACLLFVVFAAAFASAEVVTCDTLKQKIEDKIKANGVTTFTLTVVPASDTAAEGKVVGTCDGGTNKIIYSKTAAPAPQPGANVEKPKEKAKPKKQP